MKGYEVVSNVVFLDIRFFAKINLEVDIDKRLGVLSYDLVILYS